MEIHKFNVNQIRYALNTAFDDSSLSTFCFDYFPEVYDRFSQGMRKDEKITLLLDHCRRQPTGFKGLLDLRQEDESRNSQCEELLPLIDTFKSKVRSGPIIPQNTTTGEHLLIRVKIEELGKEAKKALEGQRMLYGVLPLPYYYIPRDAELARLRSALAENENVVLTALTGMGGVGKTVLARALAHDATCAERYPDGVLWGELGPEAEDETAADKVLQSWGEILGLGEQFARLPEPQIKAKFLAYHLQTRRYLIVLDDVWHTKPALLLKKVCVPHSDLLITTRSAKIAVALGMKSLYLNMLNQEEALALFTRRRGQPIQKEELRLAEELVHRLGYHPLAIQLAAAQLSLPGSDWDMLLAPLREQQGKSFELIDLDQSIREISLQFCFDLSYNALDKKGQQCYRWLGVMAPETRFTFTDMQALWSPNTPREAKVTLRALLNASLLEEVRFDGKFYYHQHLLLREDALYRLSLNKRERIAALSCHANIYRHIANQATLANDFQAISQNYAQIEAVLRRSWRAWQYKEDSIDGTLTYTRQRAFEYFNRLIFDCYNGYWHLQGLYADSLRWLPRAIHAAAQADDKNRENMHLGNMGLVYHTLGEREKAVEYYEQALSISRQIEDRKHVGIWLGKLGLIYRDLGEMKHAKDYLKQALSISRELEDQLRESEHLGNLGFVYVGLGKIQEGIQFYEMALKIDRQKGGRQYEGLHLGYLGNAYRKLGQVKQAIKYCQMALTIARSIGDRQSQRIQLGYLGGMYGDLGKVESAIDCYKQAIEISEQIGAQRTEERYLSLLAQTYGDLGKVESAIDCYKQAIKISQQTGAQHAEEIYLSTLGLACYHWGKVKEAIAYHEQALEINQKIGDRRSESINLGNLGLAYADLGKVGLAIEYYKEGLAIARQIGFQNGEGFWLGAWGLAFVNLGQVDQGIKKCEEGLQICRHISYRRGEGVVLGNLAKAVIVQGQIDRGIELCEEAISISREISNIYDESKHLTYLAEACAAKEDMMRAITLYYQALDISQKKHYCQVEAISAWNLGLLYEKQGKYTKATEFMQRRVDYERSIGHVEAEIHAQQLAEVQEKL